MDPIRGRFTWSRWGEWLTAVVAVGTALGLGGAWAMQYQNPEGNANLIGRIAYIVQDQSWMPPGVPHPLPLAGQHYFGDLAIVLGYGQALTPYIIAGMPAQYPPVAVLLFRVLGLMGPTFALVSLVVLSVSLLPLATWRLMGGLSTAQRITTTVLLVVITAPMVSALDRGGLQFVAFGLLALALLAYARGRPILAIALFVVAVSLKSYLLAFALYPLVRGHRSFAVRVIVTTIAVNGVLFLAFPGRPTVSLGGFLTSTLFYSATDMVLDGNGFASIPLRLVEMTSGTAAAASVLHSHSTLLSLGALLWLAVVVWLASRRIVPYWASMSLMLASATMVVGAAYPYNLAWAAVAAFYFGSRGSDPFPFSGGVALEGMGVNGTGPGRQSKLGKFMRVVILGTIALSLIPQFWIWDGPSGDGRRAISLLAPAAIVIATAVVFGVWTWERRRPHEQSIVNSP